MILVSLGLWECKTGKYLLWERLYKCGKWTPFCKVSLRYYKTQKEQIKGGNNLSKTPTDEVEKILDDAIKRETPAIHDMITNPDMISNGETIYVRVYEKQSLINAIKDNKLYGSRKELEYDTPTALPKLFKVTKIKISYQ